MGNLNSMLKKKNLSLSFPNVSIFYPSPFKKVYKETLCIEKKIIIISRDDL